MNDSGCCYVNTCHMGDGLAPRSIAKVTRAWLHTSGQVLTHAGWTIIEDYQTTSTFPNDDPLDTTCPRERLPLWVNEGALGRLPMVGAG